MFIYLWCAYLERISGWVTTRLMYIYVRMWGVVIESGCRFYGRMHVRKIPGSSIKIGSRCTFRSHHTSNLIGVNRPCILSTLAKGAQVQIGDGCGLSGVVIGCQKSISLGRNVRCGANALITDTDWHWDDPRAGEPSPVIIHDNVWLGVNVTVLKGVTIGENSLIAAGSVVTKSIPANVVAGGVPARVICPNKK
jgi:acetyltransferase-like isoleucine patch superfamily enzyme